MKRILFISLVLLAAFSCHRGPRRIGEADMKNIFYEMLLQEQYVKTHSEIRKQADTSLMYAAIFEKYGYNTDDYILSLNYYMEEPGRMEDIMGSVAARLEKELDVIKVESEHESWVNEFMRIYSMKVDTVHRPQPKNPLDSLHLQFSMDSLFYVKHR